MFMNETISRNKYVAIPKRVDLESKERINKKSGN